MKKSESNKEDFSKIKSKKEMDDTRKQIIHQKEKDLSLVKKNSKKNDKKNKNSKHQFAASFSEDMIKNLNLGEEDQNDSFNHDFKSNAQSVSNETGGRKIKTPKNNQQQSMDFEKLNNTW